jgi:hypothetical protein
MVVRFVGIGVVGFWRASGLDRKVVRDEELPMSDEQALKLERGHAIAPGITRPN